jgi:hypothetical protein
MAPKDEKKNTENVLHRTETAEIEVEAEVEVEAETYQSYR